jgi:hypothetical protein
VAVRDGALSVGAFTLARLSEAHEPVSHTVTGSASPAHI